MKIYTDLQQSTDEWLKLRCGILTASQVSLIMTPTLKAANNDKSRAHVYEIAAQRISGEVEETFTSYDMQRGHELEPYARECYEENYGRVTQVGFITEWFPEHKFTLGYSPDGLVGEDGLIEIKCPRKKKHIETLVSGEVPSEYILQCQTGLLVSGRKWLDFFSFYPGLPMKPIRVSADKDMHDAIISAAAAFEAQVQECIEKYNEVTQDAVLTEKIVEQEIIV